LDRKSYVRILLIHDIGESIIGDIRLYHEKYRCERLAIDFLTTVARDINPSFAEEAKRIWLEFEEGKTEAAKLVRELDKLEYLFQAATYEERSYL
ncbi:hypothetical protein BDY21DRAFT_294707, partial [Lineolata rhizophorae]